MSFLSAGRFINMIGQFIAMMMLARLGKQQLAAAALASASTLALQTLSLTLFYAISILIRYEESNGQNHKAIGKLVKNGLWLAMFVALPTACLLTHLDLFLQLLQQDKTLIELSKPYFFFMGLGIFPLLGLMVLGQFYTGIGKPHLPLFIELISFPFNLGLSYLFILGDAGFLPQGLGGIALAQTLVQTTMFFIVLLHLGSRHYAHYAVFNKALVLDWPLCHAILKRGLPIGLQFGGELAAMAVGSYLMGYWGVDALALLQLVNQYSLLITMLNISLAQSVALLVSAEYGKKTRQENMIRTYLAGGCLVLLTYCLPVLGLFCAFSSPLTLFYLHDLRIDPHFHRLILPFFTLGALFLMVDGLRHLLSGMLRGLHDSAYTSWSNLLCLWFISVPACILSFYFHKGPIMLRAVFLSGFILAIFILARRINYHLNRKHRDTMIDAKNPLLSLDSSGQNC